MSRKEHLLQLLEELGSYKLTFSSDDGDTQTAAALTFQDFLVRIQTAAKRLLPDTVLSDLEKIEIDVQDIYTVCRAHSQLLGLVPEIESILALSRDTSQMHIGVAPLIEPTLLDEIARVEVEKCDSDYLSNVCSEINGCWLQGNVVATQLLMRAVLNYVPPLFGQETFAQVAAQSSGSRKKSFEFLEKNLRNVADYQTHRRAKFGDPYPTCNQITPYQPDFEMLLQEVLVQLKSRRV